MAGTRFSQQISQGHGAYQENESPCLSRRAPVAFAVLEHCCYSVTQSCPIPASRPCSQTDCMLPGSQVCTRAKSGWGEHSSHAPHGHSNPCISQKLHTSPSPREEPALPPAPAQHPGRQQQLSSSECSEVRPEAAQRQQLGSVTQVKHFCSYHTELIRVLHQPLLLGHPLHFGCPWQCPTDAHLSKSDSCTRGPQLGHLWGENCTLPPAQESGFGEGHPHRATFLSSHLFNSSFCTRLRCGCLMSVLPLGRRCLNGWLELQRGIKAVFLQSLAVCLHSRSPRAH